MTFSNGTNQDAAPTTNGFPIVAGKTDFVRLLKAGPVMIGGAADQTPAAWLLAVNLTADHKAIVCDDPITGKLVKLSYDPATARVGGVVGIFDARTKGFVTLADAGNAAAALRRFAPSNYFAVTLH